jgi:hypothetical protein
MNSIETGLARHTAVIQAVVATEPDSGFEGKGGRFLHSQKIRAVHVLQIKGSNLGKMVAIAMRLSANWCSGPSSRLKPVVLNISITSGRGL